MYYIIGCLLRNCNSMLRRRTFCKDSERFSVTVALFGWADQLHCYIGAMAFKLMVALFAWSAICSTLVQAAHEGFDFFYFVQQVFVTSFSIVWRNVTSTFFRLCCDWWILFFVKPWLMDLSSGQDPIVIQGRAAVLHLAVHRRRCSAFMACGRTTTMDLILSSAIRSLLTLRR